MDDELMEQEVKRIGMKLTEAVKDEDPQVILMAAIRFAAIVLGAVTVPDEKGQKKPRMMAMWNAFGRVAIEDYID